MEKMNFQRADFDLASKLFLSENKKQFNFLNLYSVYSFRKERLFRESISSKDSVNFIDGFIISLFLSLTNFKRVSRLRGPTYTRKFLENKGFNKKMLFIGTCSEKDLNFISKKFNITRRNLLAYEKLPYIAPKLEFPKKEISNLVNFLKKSKPQVVLVCVGNPRQEILSKELIKRYPLAKYLVVGAALDFILEKKAEAPLIVRKIGIEWLYRLITDFKYSKVKVWRSFKGLFYLPLIVRLKK